MTAAGYPGEAHRFEGRLKALLVRAPARLHSRAFAQYRRAPALRRLAARPPDAAPRPPRPAPSAGGVPGLEARARGGFALPRDGRGVQLSPQGDGCGRGCLLAYYPHRLVPFPLRPAQKPRCAGRLAFAERLKRPSLSLCCWPQRGCGSSLSRLSSGRPISCSRGLTPRRAEGSQQPRPSHASSAHRAQRRPLSTCSAGFERRL